MMQNILQCPNFDSASTDVGCSSFLDIPEELHFKIASYFDPKTLGRLIKVCRRCQQLYDTDTNFSPFLKTEYRRQVPKQIFREMFSLDARKKYNITFQHSAQFLNGEELEFLLFRNIVNKKDLSFLSECELLSYYKSFFTPDVCDLIKRNLLSVEDMRRLPESQIQKLHKDRMYMLLINKALTLWELETLTHHQVERVCSDDILFKMLFNKRLSIAALKQFKDEDIDRICEPNTIQGWLTKRLWIGANRIISKPEPIEEKQKAEQN